MTGKITTSSQAIDNMIDHLKGVVAKNLLAEAPEPRAPDARSKPHPPIQDLDVQLALAEKTREARFRGLQDWAYIFARANRIAIRAEEQVAEGINDARAREALRRYRSEI